MKFDESGWLLPSAVKATDKPFDIDIADLNSLLQLAHEEDLWAAGVRQTVKNRLENPEISKSQRLDWILEHAMIQNTGGTIITMPFGKDIITFNSNRHFFRGENQQYPQSTPSLIRKIQEMDEKSKELYKAISCMRAFQFHKFIWQINVVPYWEAKLSDINIDALAQHYGFETCLLDLTNDFRTALFFATCKYNYESDSYSPLTQKDIEQSEASRYGMIFHAPNWTIDYLNGGSMHWNFAHMNDKRERPYSFYSGDLDGMAFQIGYQPLMRCHHQSGYIFPMMNSQPLQKNTCFEKLRFKQSEALSNQVFEMMDGGKKVFPNEGISLALDAIRKIQKSSTFSHDDVMYAYDFCEIGKSFWSSVEDFEIALLEFKTIPDIHINLQTEEIVYSLDEKTLCLINSLYDDKDLLDVVGHMIHQLPEHRRYREQRCIDIYGELI